MEKFPINKMRKCYLFWFKPFLIPVLWLECCKLLNNRCSRFSFQILSHFYTILTDVYYVALGACYFTAKFMTELTLIFTACFLWCVSANDCVFWKHIVLNLRSFKFKIGTLLFKNRDISNKPVILKAFFLIYCYFVSTYSLHSYIVYWINYWRFIKITGKFIFCIEK